MLGSKWVFKIIFFLTGVVVLWMCANFSTKYILHKKFSEYAVGYPIHWGILSKSPEAHYIYVDYSFEVRGERYSSQYVFSKPLFKSREAAQIGIEAKKSGHLDVWVFGKENPLSILENHFPYNELIRFILTTVIFAYFYFLRNYIKQFTRSEPVQA